MYLYRIVQKKARTSDLSGTGAYRVGGRWNSKGTYMVYCSENSSLAYLETLVHFDKSLAPPNLFIMQLEMDDSAPIYKVKDSEYPKDWMNFGIIENQKLGDGWMSAMKYLAILVRSAVNTIEYNYLLNPLFPNYTALVKVVKISPIDMDGRLVI